MTYKPNPDLDLVLERTVPVPPEKVWAAWTEPELMKQWFTPAPWKTVDAEVDLRPGGRFRITMESPDGEQFPNNAGCFLELKPNELLMWTSVMSDDYRPAVAESGADDLPFTARIELSPDGNGGTSYRAVAMHADEAGRNQHEQMGFIEGWGAALDQLVALMG